MLRDAGRVQTCRQLHDSAIFKYVHEDGSLGLLEAFTDSDLQVDIAPCCENLTLVREK